MIRKHVFTIGAFLLGAFVTALMGESAKDLFSKGKELISPWDEAEPYIEASDASPSGKNMMTMLEPFVLQTLTSHLVPMMIR